jgi:putative hydrolase of HD superfamily
MENVPITHRLKKQLEFLLEIDRLKQVLRQSYICRGLRKENSSEHSWHLALMAIVLAEHAREPVDVCRVVKMALVHDLVEIDAGDTFCYDAAGNADKPERERIAAERIFGLLPPDQNADLRGLWDEFEERRTAEARFAAALDRLMPLMHNYYSGGKTWQEHDVPAALVFERNRHIEQGSAGLWAFAESLIRDAIAKNMLKDTHGSDYS